MAAATLLINRASARPLNVLVHAHARSRGRVAAHAAAHAVTRPLTGPLTRPTSAGEWEAADK